MQDKFNIFSLLMAIGMGANLTACSGSPSSRQDTANLNVQSVPLTKPEQTNGQAADNNQGKIANAEFKDKLRGEELLSALQKGGHVIYFRHTQTNKGEKDQADSKSDLTNCELQRQLSQEGTQQAQDIGAAFTAKNIPVGEVITSEYCRTWKTADSAFGQHVKNPRLNYLPTKTPSPQQRDEAKKNVKPLLTALPKAEKNTVIVGHSDIFEVTTGILPEPEGVAYVMTPNGKGDFVLEANVLPEEWSKL